MKCSFVLFCFCFCFVLFLVSSYYCKTFFFHYKLSFTEKIAKRIPSGNISHHSTFWGKHGKHLSSVNQFPSDVSLTNALLIVGPSPIWAFFFHLAFDNMALSTTVNSAAFVTLIVGHKKNNR